MSLDVNISEPDEFNCTELHSCIDVIAKQKGLEDFVYHVDFISGNGGNFTSNVFRILIKDGQSDKNYSVMVKTLINTERQELFHELHVREVNVYKNILKKYEEIQTNLDVEERVLFPNCVYSRIELSKEVIILEDMKAKGYETDSKLASGLNYAQVSTAIKELGKFHVLSFIYEKQDPETFATVKSEFQDVIFSERFLNRSSKLRNYFHESFGMCLNLVEDLEAKNKLEKVQPRLLELLKMYTRPGNYNVLCHGDCWINNIMFKHEDNKAKVCFIDFQVMRYSSPLTDIFYLLLSTDSTFRSAYFKTLMSDYYDTLKSFLGVYNIDVNSVYPKEDFENDCVDFLPFGLLIAMVHMRILEDNILKESEEELELNEVEAVATESVTSSNKGDTEILEDKFKIKVNDLVNDCARNGVLDKLINKINGLEIS